MFKKIVKLLVLFAGLFNLSKCQMETRKYLSKSYLEDNEMYVYQNFCHLDDNNDCVRIIKMNLRNNDKRMKQYYNIDDNLENRINSDFNDIDINRLME